LVSNWIETNQGRTLSFQRSNPQVRDKLKPEVVIASVEAYLISELRKKLLLASLEAYQLRQKTDSFARNLAKASMLIRLDLIHIFEGIDPQPF